MRVATTENGWALESIGDLEWLFLERLPGMASGEELPPEQKRRLFPDPINGGTDLVPGQDEFLEDWDEFVRPELHTAFAESRDRVADDLKAVTEGASDRDRADAPEKDGTEEESKKLFRLEVAGAHSEDWYSTLNQARLLMNEVYDLAESEQRLYSVMAAAEEGEDGEGEGDPEESVDGRLWLLLAQYQFYSFIQTFLLDKVIRP